jgi:hypothetical protein
MDGGDLTPALVSPAAIAAASSKSDARFLRPRFIDVQAAAAELGFVQVRDRFHRIAISGHLDEGEATRAAGFAFAHHVDRLDDTNSREQGVKIGIVDVIGEVADV